MKQYPQAIVSLDALHDDPENPQAHSDAEISRLRAVIEEVGFIQPIAVDARTMTILAGHGRAEAARLLHMTEIPAVLVDDYDETKRRLALISTNGNYGHFDDDALTRLLRDLDAEHIDLDLAGLEPWRVEELLGNEAAAGLTDADDVPETPTVPITKPGDLILMGEHRLLCGDATKREDVETLMDGRKADMVLTDPPYGMRLDTDFSTIKGSMRSIGRQRGTRGNTYESVIGDNEDYDASVVMALCAAVPEQFWWGADYYAETIPARGDGSWIVWDKRKDSQADAIGSEFELCWSKKRHKRRVLRHDWFGFLSSGNIADARNRVHPTQKPTSLFVDVLEQWGGNARIVLDLYAGSGTTMIAAEQTSRTAYLMEIDPKYCDVIVSRWEAFTGKRAERPIFASLTS